MTSGRFDIHQYITNQIIEVTESGAGAFQLPWRRTKNSSFFPKNISSEKPYSGVNVLSLWAAANSCGYNSGLWGTFKQWQSIGAKVRKGEKATYIVFY